MNSPAVAFMVCLLSSAACQADESFSNAQAAVDALVGKDFDKSSQAQRYLAERPAESVPLLLPLVREKKDGWIAAYYTLGQTKDERVVPFLVDLLKANYYLKDADGKRLVFGYGSPHGCMVMPNSYGAAIVKALGQQKDRRALPVLREACEQGDDEVKRAAYKARYDLHDVGLDDLFDLQRKYPRLGILNEIASIGSSAIHSDTQFALKVFNRVILETQKGSWEAQAAHLSNVQCYSLLRQYDQALAECDEVLKYPEHGSLCTQAKDKKVELGRLRRATSTGAEAAQPRAPSSADSPLR
jgi:hypothetical protein